MAAWIQDTHLSTSYTVSKEVGVVDRVMPSLGVLDKEGIWSGVFMAVAMMIRLEDSFETVICSVNT